MKKQITGLRFHFMSCVLIGFALPAILHSQARDLSLDIHLRGVYESKISLLALSANRTFKPIIELPGIKNGETARLIVSKDYLPGEFVIRLDYKEMESSTPYPSEKYIFINDQDLELLVSPKYSNNPDSSYFQAGERENSAFSQFSSENGMQKEKLGVLQNFLMGYDETESAFYQQAIHEYEKRRKAYNQWLADRVQEDKALFVSSLYSFQYVPEIPWKGSETDRIWSLINHYFDGINFNDSLIIKTSDINKWMDNYVNLHGQFTTSIAMRDSLFPLAGKNAIEKARTGHPLVYGWMVDYFYRGYEANGIDAGIKILEPYLDDPNCLTSKRQEIIKRLKGMETLVQGSHAPNIIMKDPEGKLFELYKFDTNTGKILIQFWSADCSHCMEFIEKLHPWQQQPEIREKLAVVAISLDETETEIEAWQRKVQELTGWKHLLAAEGINSKVAEDYYVLATPVLVLIDAKTYQIVAMPASIKEIESTLK